MLNLLVSKNIASTREEGRKYLYRAVAPKQRTGVSALRNLVRTFFAGVPVDAVAALLDGSAGKLTDDDLRDIRKMIEKAEKSRSTPTRKSTEELP